MNKSDCTIELRLITENDPEFAELERKRMAELQDAGELFELQASVNMATSVSADLTINASTARKEVKAYAATIVESPDIATGQGTVTDNGSQLEPVDLPLFGERLVCFLFSGKIAVVVLGDLKEIYNETYRPRFGSFAPFFIYRDILVELLDRVWRLTRLPIIAAWLKDWWG